MKIKEIRFRHFRRFSDLTIGDLPPSAKLVVMVGPNGTGKSSIFDGFISYRRQQGGWGLTWDALYHVRQSDDGDLGNTECHVEFHTPVSNKPEERRKLFYVRSAHRNDPDFGKGRIDRPELATSCILRKVSTMMRR